MPNNFVDEITRDGKDELSISMVLYRLDDNEWEIGSDFVKLDGYYSFEELEALVLAARKQGYLTSSREE